MKFPFIKHLLQIVVINQSINFSRTLHQGIHDLRVWPGKIADGDGTTPGKAKSGSGDEMSKLAKVSGAVFG